MNHGRSRKYSNNNNSKKRLLSAKNSARFLTQSLHFVLVLLLVQRKQHLRILPNNAAVSAFTPARVVSVTPPRHSNPHSVRTPVVVIRRLASSLSEVCFPLADCFLGTTPFAPSPLVTPALTASLCAGLGDAAAQWRSSTTTWNAPRGLTAFVKGGVAGVIWSQWYTWLDPVVANAFSATENQHSPWMAALLSTVLEQVTFSPMVLALWDLPVPMLCRGDPWHQVPGQVRALLLPVCLENAKLWTWANLVVYSAPLPYRVALTSCADAVWQMLLAEQLAAGTTEPAPVFLVADDESTVTPTGAPVLGGEVYSPVVE